MNSFIYNNGDIVCDCGNDPTLEGFFTSDANGVPKVDDPAWDGVHYTCERCLSVHAPVFTGCTDHDDVNHLTMPNAEMAGGILVAWRNGYSVTIDLSTVTDEEGLPAVGDEPELAAKIAQVLTGRQGLVFVTDEPQTIDGWELTFVSAASLG